MVNERKDIQNQEDEPRLPEWFKRLIELLKKEKELLNDINVKP